MYFNKLLMIKNLIIYLSFKIYLQPIPNHLKKHSSWKRARLLTDQNKLGIIGILTRKIKVGEGIEDIVLNENVCNGMKNIICFRMDWMRRKWFIATKHIRTVRN
eukprot:308414_1